MPSPPSPSAHLLHADEEQLDRAAILLGTGTAFVVAVCPADLRAAALGRLRSRVKGLALPGPVEVGAPEEMLGVLVEQVEQRDRVLSLTLGRDVMGALDALNLHREKVLRGGPVIVWLLDGDALSKMRERAPDAFAFRSTMAIVRGDGGPLPAPRGEEPEEVTRARKRLKRARSPLERAEAGHTLAEELRVRGRLQEAEALARSSLNMLPGADNDEERLTRSRLSYTLSGTASVKYLAAQDMYWSLRALAEIQDVSLGRGLEQQVLVKASFPGPFAGRDRLAVRDALALVDRYGLGPEARAPVLHSAAALARFQGDLLRARALSREWRSLDRYISAFGRANVAIEFGNLDRAAGDLAAAERSFRNAAAAMLAEGGLPFAPLLGVARCLMECGEIQAAEAVASEAAGYVQDRSVLIRIDNKADISLVRGDIVEALEMCYRAIREAKIVLTDRTLRDACSDLVAAVELGQEAARLAEADLVDAVAELATVQDIVSSIVGPDGPSWYPIEFLHFRADVLVLTPTTLSQAIALSRQACDLARSTYADLVPASGRSLADHLLRASRPDDALAVIADTEPEAVSRGFVKERALLLADRIIALVQRGDPPAAIEPALVALREALSATGSARTTAETLRDLAKRLPPETPTPDPHALAEEAHGLFIAMPMPAEEARCLEIMADVLVARERVDEAKRRYLTARARLERYGLGLRLPLLDRKLAALG